MKDIFHTSNPQKTNNKTTGQRGNRVVVTNLSDRKEET